MLLTGHEAGVTTIKFDPSGRYVASGSNDKRILLWNVYSECDNFNVLEGHKNVILDLEWNRSGSKIVTASADKTVGVFDANTGKRLKKYSGHSGCVNAVNMSRGSSPLAVSGSDDGHALLWDLRQRSAVQTFEAPFAITAVSFSDDDELVFTAGIDNVVRAWDRRREEVVFTLEGHKGWLSLLTCLKRVTWHRHSLNRAIRPCFFLFAADTVTGMSLSPDGASLLTNSMDKTLISWDVRPFVTGSRFSKQFEGAQVFLLFLNVCSSNTSMVWLMISSLNPVSSHLSTTWRRPSSSAVGRLTER
jgi:Prp8 binding protein